MIMTVVEGHVGQEHWAALQEAYTTVTGELTPGIVQTFLLHNLGDPTLWQIVTIWSSVEALRGAGQPGETRPADRMFLAAGAEPTHTVFDIPLQASARPLP